MLYHDNDEDRSDDDFMSHAWWWSRASYFQIRSPSHPDPIHDPFLGPLTFRRHHAQHLILLLLTIMIMFFMTFPPELKSVASASSTGAVTSSARHAQSLSSSLSVNNLLITIKRPFSTKTSFWFYAIHFSITLFYEFVDICPRMVLPPSCTLDNCPRTELDPSCEPAAAGHKYGEPPVATPSPHPKQID